MKLAIPVVAAVCSIFTLCSTVRSASQPALDLAEQWLDVADTWSNQNQTVSAAQTLRDAVLPLIVDQPRLQRKAIDITLRLGEREKALELLNAYRKLDPNDQLAQVQTIDLLVDGMQTADARKQYLSRIISSESVHRNVRSHAGVKLFSVLTEMGDDQQAAEALNQALLLNPFNPRALQLRVEKLFHSGAPAQQRAAALVDLLKSNPMQPGVVISLAEELARCGADEQSIQLYRSGFEITRLLGMTPDAQDLTHLSSLLSAQGKHTEAAALATLATQITPSSPNAWFMRIMVEMQAGNDSSFASALSEAKSALTRNLMVLHRSIDPQAPEVTEQTPAALPDVRNDAKSIDPSNPQAQMYVAALGDYAWLDAYFSGQPVDPAVMEALITLTGENSVLVTRLQGFSAWKNRRTDEAKVKLSAIADRDFLAKTALAAIRLEQGESRDTILKEASELLSQMPLGVWASMVRYSLRDLGPISFSTPEKSAVVVEASKLPEKWLNFPQTPGNFYLLELRPLKVGLAVGEPMLLRLRVQNVSEFPLVIGPGGVLDQSVAIDAQVRGPLEQYFPGVAVAKLSSDLVLQPRQSTFANVRIDSGELGSFFQGLPHLPLSVYASAISNPRLVQQAQGVTVVPGPGGLRAQGESVIDRPPAALQRPDIREQINGMLKSNDPAKRLGGYLTLIGNIRVIQNTPQTTADQKDLVEQGQKILEEAFASESDPFVRALVMQQKLVLLTDPQQVVAHVQSMLGASDRETRLTGCIISARLKQDQRLPLLRDIENDSDESIRRIASTLLHLKDSEPTTTPSESE